MLQEQTVTFPSLFLFDLMIWLQVSFCFDCLVLAEARFVFLLFSFPSIAVLSAYILVEPYFLLEIRREAHRTGDHRGGV